MLVSGLSAMRNNLRLMVAASLVGVPQVVMCFSHLW